MSQPTAVALDLARSLLNDINEQLWINSVLVLKIQQAHRELQVQLRANACPVTRAVIESPVDIFTTVLETPPTDIVEPITLWEKAPLETDAHYVRMTEYDPLPVVDPGQRLVWWRWDGSAISFIGCLSPRRVKLYYKKFLPVPSTDTDFLGVIDGELYIGPRAAALAYGSTGNTMAAQWCTDMANQSLADILIANRGRVKTNPRP